METRLAVALPRATRAHVQALAATLVSPSQGLDPEVAAGLLNEGCSPHSLHASFIYCRDVMLRHRLPKLLEQPEPERLRAIELLLSHFDYIQAQFVDAMEQHWRIKLEHSESKLLDEGQAHLLTRARNLWLKDGFIELYNHHQQSLVSARVPVAGVREKGLSVALTPDLVLVLTAGEHRRYTHTRLPDANFVLRLAVEGKHGQTVHLHDAGIMQAPSEHRRYVRAQAAMLVPVTLFADDGQPWHGVVQDYSSLGLGVQIKKEGVELGNGTCLRCETRIRNCDVQGMGRVCWSRGEEGHTRIGLDLGANYGLRQRLRREVSHWQQQLNKYLRLQGTPDCLM